MWWRRKLVDEDLALDFLNLEEGFLSLAEMVMRMDAKIDLICDALDIDDGEETDYS